MRARGIVLAVAVLVGGAACSDDEPAPSTAPAATTTPPGAANTTTAPPVDPIDPDGLRAAGDAAGVRIGAALLSERLDDEAVADLVAAQLSSLTPENEMKWSVVEAERDVFDFAGADRLVAFAEENDIAVRGHTLVWGQAVGNGMPEWLVDLPPAEVEAEVGVFIDTSMGRYAGQVERWDVVNEPISLAGTGLDDNPISRALGPDWVAWALDRAEAADPDAELWINEHSVEYQPEKADALVGLVEDLLAAGAPLDGVGLQTHMFSGVPPDPGVLGALVERLRGLGVAVAITELDVPLVDTPEGSPGEGGSTLDTQAAAYAQVVGECVAAGCEEVTVWGIDDGHTWLDDVLGRDDTDPLLFDAALEPKPAFAAVRDALG